MNDYAESSSDWPRLEKQHNSKHILGLNNGYGIHIANPLFYKTFLYLTV